MEFPEKWLQDDSLGELISCELRLQIIKGDIERGTVLTENQISTRFETSRSPVREAFKILKTEGLVELGRMGAVVHGLDEMDIKELNDVRFLLEHFCLQKISRTFDEEKAKEFYQILDLMELNAKHNDYLEFSYNDLSFHEKIIKQAGHKRISHSWENIRNIILCLLLVATEKRFSEQKGEIGSLLRNHRDVIEALLAKDEERLESLTKKHLVDTNNTVIDAYIRGEKV
ncbi:GntR family transcriptional regulator [Halalkalibacter okhensis]|uniref:HTH gntR-type domain-containing protein n=1 Tax=Halalkalibacter okhensis TaxID=333138 RepID=A0A0B0IB00_9BACI|nr:GntR family transcriptional regulator [Halalkalibacter okhensis]KHF38450.1 hypothetical protein LQ50_21180 [Halalkalibacter okhensis]